MEKFVPCRLRDDGHIMYKKFQTNISVRLDFKANTRVIYYMLGIYIYMLYTSIEMYIRKLHPRRVSAEDGNFPDIHRDMKCITNL